MRALAGVLLACALLLPRLRVAQPHGSASDFDIDAALRSQIIEQVLRGLDESYVLPAVAQQMTNAVRERVRRREYDTLESATAFAQKLTADLQAVSKDKHLRVKVSPPRGAGDGQERAWRSSMERQADADHGGFARVETLPGNIGYIELLMFHSPNEAADDAAAAMEQVGQADALIIDLRRNGGGSAEMVALLVSYLVEPKPVLVNSFVNREGRVHRETWTTRDLPAKRFLGKDVYLLTSGFTFSAAEEFAYDLKNLKRATIIGETTGGGANPVDMFRIGDRFEVSIPVSRAVNAITGANWEGVGVDPDVNVPAAVALHTAHLAALTKQLERTSDPSARERLQTLIDQTRARSDV